ncbi:MAG: rhodanese-like domain-containing protein [Rubrivivax sp.]
MLFRQLFDPVSCTYTYLLADAGEAILIDPVFDQAARDAALVRELGLHLVATAETHVHADHVSAGWLHKSQSGSRIAIAAASGVEGADLRLMHGDRVAFGRRFIEARATPGHTDGCMTYVLDDASRAFTGDALLVRGCGRTDFQQGSAERLYRSVHGQIFTLPDHCLLYPGHDYRGLTVSSVAEERRFNPRLGGDSNLGDFVGHMKNLSLPHPKLIDIAVPANLRCGRPEGTAAAAGSPAWAPLTLTFAGIWEITPAALEELAGEAQIVDVREPAEFDAELGHIAGAKLIPLGALGERAAAKLDSTRPVVLVCRSGTRSAQATVLLGRAGFTQVANLAGGMLRWRAEGRPAVSALD